MQIIHFPHIVRKQVITTNHVVDRVTGKDSESDPGCQGLLMLKAHCPIKYEVLLSVIRRSVARLGKAGA